MRRALLVPFVLVIAVAACSGGDSDATCPAPIEPERVVDSSVDIDDLSVTVPKGTLDMTGDGDVDDVRAENGVVTVDDLVLSTTEPAGVSIRTWADVDGDGDDDLLVDDGRLWLIDGGRFTGRHDIRTIGEPIAKDLTSIWPGDLDGTPGGDFYVVREDASHTTTDVYSGKRRPPTRHLRGAPRALARLEKGGQLETVMLDAGPPSAITFAPIRRATLQVDLGESHRVTWVRVFDENGTRKIALQVDRKVAVWPVPEVCR